jgi:hypothetical protein
MTAKSDGDSECDSAMGSPLGRSVPDILTGLCRCATFNSSDLNGRMRALAVAVVSAGVLVTCAGMETHKHTSGDFRRLDTDFSQAWEGAVRILIERGFDIRTIDRNAGIIETGWLTINSEYAATIFFTEQEDRYSTCGRPVLGQAFRTKEARLALTLSPARRGETNFRVEAFFRTQRYSDALLWSNRPLGDEECSSRGRLEEEIRVQVQLRALADRLDRLRRGAP